MPFAKFDTTAQVLDHLRSLVLRTKAGESVLARDVDPALQEDPEALAFAQLDAVSSATSRSLS